MRCLLPHEHKLFRYPKHVPSCLLFRYGSRDDRIACTQLPQRTYATVNALPDVKSYSCLFRRTSYAVSIEETQVIQTVRVNCFPVLVHGYVASV